MCAPILNVSNDPQPKYKMLNYTSMYNCAIAQCDFVKDVEVADGLKYKIKFPDINTSEDPSVNVSNICSVYGSLINYNEESESFELKDSSVLQETIRKILFGYAEDGKDVDGICPKLDYAYNVARSKLCDFFKRVTLRGGVREWNLTQDNVIASTDSAYFNGACRKNLQIKNTAYKTPLSPWANNDTLNHFVRIDKVKFIPYYFDGVRRIGVQFDMLMQPTQFKIVKRGWTDEGKAIISYLSACFEKMGEYAADIYTKYGTKNWKDAIVQDTHSDTAVRISKCFMGDTGMGYRTWNDGNVMQDVYNQPSIYKRPAYQHFNNFTASFLVDTGIPLDIELGKQLGDDTLYDKVQSCITDNIKIELVSNLGYSLENALANITDVFDVIGYVDDKIVNIGAIKYIYRNNVFTTSDENVDDLIKQASDNGLTAVSEFLTKCKEQFNAVGEKVSNANNVIDFVGSNDLGDGLITSEPSFGPLYVWRSK